ncbi:hypothetical protein GA0115246_107791 [Streptomyces sp. SolWspMP-sol7th]|nr:hypothetical protein GA0115246_107791 [Streptomyces sp. SolWspMP-sol7th]
MWSAKSARQIARPTHYEAVRDRALPCHVMPPGAVLPDQTTCAGPARPSRAATSEGVLPRRCHAWGSDRAAYVRSRHCGGSPRCPPRRLAGRWSSRPGARFFRPAVSPVPPRTAELVRRCPADHVTVLIPRIAPPCARQRKLLRAAPVAQLMVQDKIRLRGVFTGSGTGVGHVDVDRPGLTGSDRRLRDSRRLYGRSLPGRSGLAPLQAPENPPGIPSIIQPFGAGGGESGAVPLQWLTSAVAEVSRVSIRPGLVEVHPLRSRGGSSGSGRSNLRWLLLTGFLSHA